MPSVAPASDDEKQFAEEVKKILDAAPEYKGMTVQEIAKELNQPVSTTRVHVCLMEAEGRLGSIRIGKSKIYSLLSKTATAGKAER